MKATYDQATDAMYIQLKPTKYHVTRKVTDDVLVDYSRSGAVVGIEILAASKNTVMPKQTDTIPFKKLSHGAIAAH